MESFKQAMSFLLFATAGYLLWVYAGLIKLENLLDPVFGLSAVAVAGWIYGRWCLPHRTQRARVIGGVTAVAQFLEPVPLGGSQPRRAAGQHALPQDRRTSRQRRPAARAPSASSGLSPTCQA